MASLTSAFTINCAFSAAVAAHLSFIHRADRAVCGVCAGIAVCLLIAALGFLLMHRASLVRVYDVGTARMMRTAPAVSHAPVSLQAPARDHLHCSALLPCGAL